MAKSKVQLEIENENLSIDLFLKEQEHNKSKLDFAKKTKYMESHIGLLLEKVSNLEGEIFILKTQVKPKLQTAPTL